MEIQNDINDDINDPETLRQLRGICLHCGESKDGAFFPCPACGHRPKTKDDMTRHLIVTEYVSGEKNLEAFSQMVKNGIEIEFRDEILEKLRVSNEEYKRLRNGYFIDDIIHYGFWILVITFLVLFVWGFDRLLS